MAVRVQRIKVLRITVTEMAKLDEIGPLPSSPNMTARRLARDVSAISANFDPTISKMPLPVGPMPNEKSIISANSFISGPSFISNQSTEVFVEEYSRTENDKDEKEAAVSCCHPETNPAVVIAKLVAVAAAGIVFGWCLEKGRVFEPRAIRNQMVFKQWIMLKMFLSAMATGMFLIAVVSVIPRFSERINNTFSGFAATFETKGILTSILGPTILGMGMTLSGACPGMVLAQLGSWTTNAYVTYIGALLAALFYGMVAPYIIQGTKPKQPFEKQTVHDKFGLRYAILAFPLAIIVILVVVLMEVFIPWEEDLIPVDRNVYNETNTIFELKSWPPSVSGTLIGCLQLVVLFSVGDTLGGSSSYATLTSQWVIGEKLQSLFPYLAKKRCGMGNWWQVVYVMGAMVGALLSALASQSLATTDGVEWPAALLGGFLLLFGARLAAGCTSGHGLSGVGMLFWLSFLAVPCMFGGAIILAFIMDGMGYLDVYI